MSLLCYQSQHANKDLIFACKCICSINVCVLNTTWLSSLSVTLTEARGGARGGGGVLPCMGYIGMCHCEGYGFQAVYSRIGYINQSVWV